LYANNLVEADLLAEPAAATPGEPFDVAVRLRVPPGWHISWRNPGEAGVAPALRWELPAGVAAGAIQWPAPHALQQGPVTSYALDGEVWLLVELVPARALDLPRGPAPGALALAATAGWLVCQDLCIPEKTHLSLAVPLSQKRAPPGPDAAGFALARTRIPRALGWTASLGRQDLDARTAELQVATGALAIPTSARFFPYEADAVDPAAPQTFEPTPQGLSLLLPRPKSARAMLASASGVLVLQGTDPLDTVAAEIATRPTIDASSARPPPMPGTWLALLCAFAGGMLLNLMPCVLPVLGFKVLSLVRDASAGPRRARIGGLAYAAGVIASFWVLALALLALRASGRELGWGFQLQSPATVSLLALLFFGLALGFLGYAEFGFALQRRAGAVRFSASGWGAFGSGVLATAVATPCTAPFMGVALGAALVAPVPTALGIFTALGVGMAWPYVLLSGWPALLSRVPRPGPWVQRLQQALAFPLLATVLWLLSVLAAQTGPARLLASLFGMLLLAFSLWLWRSGGAPEQPRATRALAGLGAAVLALVAALGTARPALLGAEVPEVIAAQKEGAAAGAGSPQALSPAHEQAASAVDAVAQVAWADWSEERVAQLRAEKRAVFVDFTAAWCLSCQVNERIVFSSREVRERFAALGVVPLRADWTRADPAITRALQSFGRSGVPLNVLYAPQLAQPIVLPAVLTPGIVLEALQPLR